MPEIYDHRPLGVAGLPPHAVALTARVPLVKSVGNDPKHR